MADNITDGVLAAGISQLASNSKEQNKSLEGIHEIEINLDKITKDFYDEAEKTFKEIVNLLTIIASGDNSKDNNPLKKLSGIVNGSNAKEEKNAPKKVEKNITLENLIKYNDSTVAAAAFLHRDLLDIAKLLKGDSSKDTKSKDVGKLFKGINGGSLLMVAAALVAFAGAAVLFSKVNFGAAIAGLVLFTGFVAGTLAISRILKKEEKDLKDFAKNVLLMVGAYVAFSLALLVISNIMKFTDPKGLAISLGLFTFFVVGTVGLSILLTKTKSSLKDFSAGVLLMTAGYLLFGITLAVVSKISKNLDLKSIGLTLTGFYIFTLLTIRLSKKIGESKVDFVEFAAGTLLMTSAYLLFGLAIAAIGSITKHLGLGGWASVFLSLGSFFIVISLTKMAGNAIDLPSILKLAAGSTAMTVSFLLFGLAIKALSTITLKDLLKSIGVIATMSVLVIALGALGNVLTAIMPGLIVFSAAAVLLSVSLVAFAGGMFLATTFINKISITKNTLKNIGMMSLFIAATIPLGVTAAAAMIPMGLTTAWALLAVPTFLSLFAVIKTLDSLKLNKEKFNEYSTKLNDIKSVISLISSSLNVNAKDTVRMALFVTAVAPIIAAVTSASLIINTISNLSRLNLDKEQIDIVLTSLDSVIVALGNYAEKTKGIGIKAAKAMNIALGGVTESITNISDTIIKLRSITPEEVSLANENLKMIIDKLFISKNKNDVTVSSIFESIPNVGKKALKGSEALKTITAAIESLSNTILNIKDLTTEDVDTCIMNIQKEVLFFSTASSLLDDIGSLKIKKFVKAKDNINAISECLENLKVSLPENGLSVNLNPLKQISEFDHSTFYQSTENINYGMKTLSKAASYIPKINKSINDIQTKPLEKIAVSFDKLISQTSQLKDLADTIKELANSVNTLPKSSLIDHFSVMAPSFKKQTSDAQRPAQSAASYYGEQDRNTLLNILANLNTIVKDGVKIQGNNDKHIDDRRSFVQKEEKYKTL